MKIVQTRKVVSYELMQWARLNILQQLLLEALAEIPNPVSVELVLTRYEFEEDADERPAAPVPDA